MATQEEKEAAKAAKAAEKAGAQSIDVMDKHGRVVRSYSAEVHGEHFVDLAEEFAGKFGYTAQKGR